MPVDEARGCFPALSLRHKALCALQWPSWVTAGGGGGRQAWLSTGGAPKA